MNASHCLVLVMLSTVSILGCGPSSGTAPGPSGTRRPDGGSPAQTSQLVPCSPLGTSRDPQWLCTVGAARHNIISVRNANAETIEVEGAGTLPGERLPGTGGILSGGALQRALVENPRPFHSIIITPTPAIPSGRSAVVVWTYKNP